MSVFVGLNTYRRTGENSAAISLQKAREKN
jgi:hypothetical protein